MSLRSHLGAVRGLGSAKSGTGHFIAQRATAIALVPLTLWLVSALMCIADASYSDALAWLSSPINATLILAFVIAMFWHASMGLQVVIEDYVHSEMPKLAALIAMKLLMAFLGLLSAMSILRVFLGTA